MRYGELRDQHVGGVVRTPREYVAAGRPQLWHRVGDWWRSALLVPCLRPVALSTRAYVWCRLRNVEQ